MASIWTGLVPYPTHSVGAIPTKAQPHIDRVDPSTSCFAPRKHTWECNACALTLCIPNYFGKSILNTFIWRAGDCACVLFLDACFPTLLHERINLFIEQLIGNKSCYDRSFFYTNQYIDGSFHINIINKFFLEFFWIQSACIRLYWTSCPSKHP